MVASNLHHLASTRSQPGIYSSPFSVRKPQAFDVDIETHIRTVFRANYQWQSPRGNRIAFYKEYSETVNNGIGWRRKSSRSGRS